MKALFSVLLVATLCATVALGATPTASCAVPDWSWNLYDIISQEFNASDAYGTLQLNLCQDIEKTCAFTQGESCHVCQWIGENTPNAHSYCVAYGRGEIFSTLNTTTYPNTVGTRAELFGDVCGDLGPRKTFIDILCSQPSNYLTFTGESPTCTYNFKLALRGDCKVTANTFTPSFTITTVTSSSIVVVVDDGYPWQFWSYDVELNGVLAYKGTERRVSIEGLKSGTSYNVVVHRVSGPGAAMNVVSPSVAQTVKTLSFASGLSATVSGTGSGIAIGMLITLAIIGAILVVWKFVLPKLRGDNKKGFSLVDAEKSTAFD